MGKKSFVYTGCENLEAMTEAVNYNNFLIRLVTDQLKEYKQPQVLDFGAGSGTYADMLKEKGLTVDCLEPDSKLQKILKGKGYKTGDYAHNLKPSSYDIIYAFNVMEHVEKDLEVFGQLAAALKKGGIIIIYVPAFKALWSSMDDLVGHYRRYRKPRLAKMAGDNKLKIVRLTYCDPLGFGAALAYKAGRVKSGVIKPGAVKLYDRLAFPVSHFVEPLTAAVFGKNVVLIAKKK